MYFIKEVYMKKSTNVAMLHGTLSLVNDVMIH
uniref:Uncharacterized protein n=1 Tax=Podoviridae sp. ctUS21 TaxID=2826557 RepID=A0A8S5MQ17_9CAUD|nr:MAG TPA: hypothetical protein [Podoviridae sp. ctUS21]DAR79956.1 MAG TPA: hypothetical protein [Caudoviricetes sp.]DAV86494.1 MAG TPA: hypothetical protein [Caudoviricetes sp.]